MLKKAKSFPEREPLTPDIVRSYLHEIGRTPLLTHEQEILLGKQVQQLMSLYETKQVLTRRLQREPTLQEWSQGVGLNQAELEVQLQQGQRARQRMITANLRLVVDIAKRYQKRGLELLDLVQEGTLGLQRGVEKSDPTRGYKFSIYAYWWIRQAITRVIAEKSRTIRLPIHVNERLNKIKKTQRLLSQQLGRIPTMQEIAAVMEVEMEQLRVLLNYTQKPTSLSLRVGQDEDAELQELLEAKDLLPEEYLEQEQQRHNLYRLLETLTPQCQEVIKLRFGLEDGNKWSFAKIGGRLNLSRERVRQLESKAMTQLREDSKRLSLSRISADDLRAEALPLQTI